MNWTFWVAEKGYESAMAPLVVRGAAVHGDTVTLRPLSEYEKPDGPGIVCGIVRREVVWDYQREGLPFLYLDKGYLRTRQDYGGQNLPGWWRLIPGMTHPTPYLMEKAYSAERWGQSGGRMSGRKTDGSNIIIAGSSEKFHLAQGLPHPTEWARGVLHDIRRHSDALVIYRPKPSWRNAEPIKGAVFDHGAKIQFSEVLRSASCVVTHGSIASVDAILAGVPCIVLGDAPAKPVSATEISAVSDPYWAKKTLRLQWLSNLCHFMWRPREIADGTAWSAAMEQMPYAERALAANRVMEASSRF